MGDLIQGTGGLRNVRVARTGSGRRGGARVIYYYHKQDQPTLLLQIYTKAQQENLTTSQKKQLKAIIDGIVDDFS